MYRTNRVPARTRRIAALVVAAVAIAGVGVALGAGRAMVWAAFLPPPSAPTAAAAQARTTTTGDAPRVRQLLESARGVNPLVCDLAARAVDGRSGWWSGSEGVLGSDAATDSLVRDVVSWVHHREVDVSAVPILREALSDADACVRRFAAPLLARVKDPSALQTMLAALAATDATVREMGALALGFASDSAGVAPLGRQLRTDTSPRVRATAAWALGEIERPESARVLIEALQDAEPMVRRAAARALGEIDNTIAIPALTDLLKSDRDADVRRAAAQALGEIIG